jgi:hypothetical protein
MTTETSRNIETSIESDSSVRLEQSALSVALLIDDLEEARELTRVFKKAGVHPHLYTELKDFWRGTLERLPALCLVDVKLISQGDLLLKNHPYVKAELMPLCVFDTGLSQPLMYSTYELFTLGTIRKGEPYTGQVKSALRRLNKLMSLEEKAQNEGYRTQRYDRQLTKLSEQLEQYKEKEYFARLLNSLSERFDARVQDEDFLRSIEVVLGSLKEVEEIAYFELSQTGQKLISPESHHPKFRRLPSLWLGETCKEGIAPFAQNMAAQVGVDLMGAELMSLSLRAKSENPEALLFLRINDQELLNQFDWDSFERNLSGYFARLKLRQNLSMQGPNRWIQPFELLSLLDHEFYEPTLSDEWRLIDVSFEGLIFAIDELNHRFYWRTFFEDFLKKLAAQNQLDFRLCPVGVDHVAFLVRSESFDQLFISLKNYAARFPFWKYFEEPERVLAREWRPVVQEMPLAARGYLKKIRAKTAAVAPEETQDSADQLFWSTAPQQDM